MVMCSSSKVTNVSFSVSCSSSLDTNTIRYEGFVYFSPREIERVSELEVRFKYVNHE